jgi:hypothetical protein
MVTIDISNQAIQNQVGRQLGIVLRFGEKPADGEFDVLERVIGLPLTLVFVITENLAGQYFKVANSTTAAGISRQAAILEGFPQIW